MIESPGMEVGLALSRIERKLQTVSSPAVARRLADWMDSLSPTGRAADYFSQRSLFPMVLLPVWMTEADGRLEDHEFQSDLTYSTINGYYFVRMVDNVIDDDGSVEAKLLPMSAFFHGEFQRIYQRYFDLSHAFWRWFDSLWLASADAVCREAVASDMDLEGFCRIAAVKMSAAKIPLVALHYRSGESTDLAAWLRFTERLAALWQFFDDLMDWHKDYSRGACSYFLCEGQRRRQPRESVHQWVAREGFQWGADTLMQWMCDLQELVRRLHSNPLQAFLDDRMQMFRAILNDILPGLGALAQLGSAMDCEPQAGLFNNH